METKTPDVLVNVSVVHATHDTDEVNKYLATGWVLLSIATGQASNGQNEYAPNFAYCLGKLK